MKVWDVTNFLGLTNYDPGQSKGILPKFGLRPLSAEPQQTVAQANSATTEPETLVKVKMEPEERKVLYSWQADSRPVKKPISKKTMQTLIVMGVVLAVLLVAIQEVFLIFGIASLIFVVFMLSHLPVEQVKYEITNQGINYSGQFFEWPRLSQFFFTKGDYLDVVAVDVKDGLPARLFLTIKPEDHEKVKGLLNEYLLYLEQEPKTFLDKAYENVIGKINLDR